MGKFPASMSVCSHSAPNINSKDLILSNIAVTNNTSGCSIREYQSYRSLAISQWVTLILIINL